MKKSFEFTMKPNGRDIDFRATIKLLMIREKITIARLARLADLNYGTVFYFLKGTSQMRLPNLSKLLKILIKTNILKG